ncbi:hypothetical protein [Priestia aryabhattai]
MKSLMKVTCTAFIFTSLMAACSEKTSTPKQETTQHKVEASTKQKKSKEMSEEERLEKGILLYGEGAKGGYYGSTVENAKYEKADKMGYITARVTINNVREDGKTIDLSEIKYSVKDEKTGKMYKGQAMPMYEDKFKAVPAGYSLTFDVSFMMEKPPKDLNNMYLYMDSKIDPFVDTHWKLDNLD